MKPYFSTRRPSSLDPLYSVNYYTNGSCPLGILYVQEVLSIFYNKLLNKNSKTYSTVCVSLGECDLMPEGDQITCVIKDVPGVWASRWDIMCQIFPEMTRIWREGEGGYRGDREKPALLTHMRGSVWCIIITLEYPQCQ